MIKKLRLNIPTLKAGMVLSFMLSSVGAMAHPSFVGNVESNTTQSFSYSSITHNLQSTALGGNQNHTPATSFAYTVGSDARTVRDSFKNQAGTVIAHDTNSDQLDQNNGISKEREDTKGNVLSYSYNNNGIQRINYLNTKNKSYPKFHISYSHNSFGEVTQIYRSSGYSTFNIYGANGRLDEIIIGSREINDPVKLNIKESWTYNYGAGGNLTSVSFYSNTYKKATTHWLIPIKAKGADGNVTYTYQYNDHNQLTGFIVPTQAKSNKGSLYPTDQFGNPISQRQYSYGLNSNIHNITTTYAPTLNSTQVIKQYSYNQGIGEPTQLYKIITNTSQPIDSKLTNLSAEIAAEQDLNNSQYYYHYNAYGATTQTPGGNVYRYNDLNQMIEGENKQVNSKQIYSYGTNSLLDYEQSTIHNQHTKDPKASEINGNPVYFFYEGGVQPIDQQQGNQANKINNNYYLPGLATFNNQQGTTELYEVAQGNVAITTHNQIISNQYLYTPYGQQSDLYNPVILPISTPGNTNYADLTNEIRKTLNISKNQWGYTGQAKDSSTGLMMLGDFREYDTTQKSYRSPDLLNSFSKPNVYNTYAYIKVDPTLYTDPTGKPADPTGDPAADILVKDEQIGRLTIEHEANKLGHEMNNTFLRTREARNVHEALRRSPPHMKLDEAGELPAILNRRNREQPGLTIFLPHSSKIAGITPRDFEQRDDMISLSWTTDDERKKLYYSRRDTTFLYGEAVNQWLTAPERELDDGLKNLQILHMGEHPNGARHGGAGRRYPDEGREAALRNWIGRGKKHAAEAGRVMEALLEGPWRGLFGKTLTISPPENPGRAAAAATQ